MCVCELSGDSWWQCLCGCVCVCVCDFACPCVWGCPVPALGAGGSVCPSRGLCVSLRSSCWTRNSNMNYWLIIRLPILFAIGVSDAVGRQWELQWARALREDGVARAF